MIASARNISSRLVDVIKANVLPLLMLLMATSVAYWEVTTHSILINWDDHVYITHNHAIRELSLQNLKTIFSEYYVGNYAPVQMLSYMVDYAVWGNNPVGYFLANITYHFISGVLLYFLLVRLGFWRWGAVFGTAIFLVHPAQVETVAWLSQRKNLLAMLLYLLAFHGYLSYRESDGNKSRMWRYYGWSVITFSLALLSKSVAVIFPLMLVMYDHLIPKARRSLAGHRDKIPYLIAAGIIGVIAIISQGGSYGGGRVEYPPNALVVLPLTMLPVLLRYLRLVLWPDPAQQSIMYFPPLRSDIDLVVVMSLCIVIALLAVGVYLYRKNRPCLFWYVLFFLGLLPVSQLIPLATLMNDRYLYFPMLGVAGAVAHLSGYFRREAGVELRGRIALVISVIIVLALAVTSHLRGKVWRNSISLFSDAVTKYPDQTDTWSRLAEGYVSSGDLAIAQSYYEKAARFGPLDADARHNLAKIYLVAGEYDKAYQQIWWLLLRGDQSKINILLLGEYYYRIGSYPEAEQYLSSYLEEFPTDSHGLYLLGRVFFMAGNFAAARELYYHAAAEASNSPELYYGIACLESMEGHPDQSFAALATAVEKGLTSRHLREDERCLVGMRGDQRLAQMIRNVIGE